MAALQPSIAVLAGTVDARQLKDLFARRGFAVTVMPRPGSLESYFARRQSPSVALLDFAHEDARAAVEEIARAQPKPVLVGIMEPGRGMLDVPGLDASFARPVDRARLFVQVVELLSLRRRGRRKRKLSGIVGAVEGNDLFEALASELAVVVPPVNAGAILEAALRELGVSPFLVRQTHVGAMLESGKLAAALSAFTSGPALALVLDRISALAIRADDQRGPSRVTAT